MPFELKLPSSKPLAVGAIARDVGLPTINEHIKKIYADSELEEAATIRNFRIVQTEGSRQVTRDTKHYSLQMIINCMTSLEYRYYLQTKSA